MLEACFVYWRRKLPSTLCSAFRIAGANARMSENEPTVVMPGGLSPSSRRRFSQGAARGSSPEGPHPRGTKPSTLRLAWAETSMNIALASATNTASGRPAPRCAPLRLAPGCEYAEYVWSMQASGLAGRMNLRSTKHHRPNQPLKRTRRTASPCFAGLVPARRLAAFRWGLPGVSVFTSPRTRS